ncbi:MAG: hypothetical protein MUF19_04005 [Candidatus Pacebacteria bacterium]|nr:hypothetical protein [Candidatus Paceibacterota bacterium]
MAVHLQITGQLVGRTWLYEEMGRAGRKTLVPTYRLVLSVDETDVFVPDQYFAVTRDSSVTIFASSSPHYGSGGECPPSRVAAPYHAVWHQHGNLPDALRLYEPGANESQHRVHATLRGVGPERRRGVLIHHGPARTEGCFSVAGGRAGWRAFLSAVRQFEQVTRNPHFYVHVLPRHFGAENPLTCP